MTLSVRVSVPGNVANGRPNRAITFIVADTANKKTPDTDAPIPVEIADHACARSMLSTEGCCKRNALVTTMSSPSASTTPPTIPTTVTHTWSHAVAAGISA